MSKTVGAYEAKTHLAALLEEVEAGHEVIITKQGRPVARLVPYAAEGPERRAEAVRNPKIFGKGQTLGRPLKQAVEEGRE